MTYSCLNISREEFETIYAGLPILNYVDLFFNKPVSDVDLINNYLTSKLWRLNNIYTIIDKYGNMVRFRMNRSQHIVYAASLRHPRIIILKSRQQGISTLWLVSFSDDALFFRNFSIGLMAQGIDESSTLLNRTKILWEELNPMIKDFLGIYITKDNTNELAFSNKSTIFIRTSFRSTTLQRLHISEMGKIANKYPEKAKETKTGTLQALAQGNIGVVESTAEGDNMFKSMWDNAELNCGQLSPKDFLPIFLSWIDDPDCIIERQQIISEKHAKYFKEVEAQLTKDRGVFFQLTQQQKNFWIVQYRELGDKIYQEYPSTAIEAFMATKEGAYWAKLYLEWVKGHKRELHNLFDPNLEVELSIDLGMDDTNVLLAFQTYKEQFRLIGEFCDNGQDIEYYCNWIKDQPWFPNLSRVILPHDAEVNELTSGMTRTQKFEEQLAYDKQGNPTSIVIDVLPKTDSVNEDIEQVRQVLKNLWIDPLLEYIKFCLLNFKKEWDDRREVWRNKPEHSEASNGAAAIRYMVIGATRGTNYKKKSVHSKSEVAHRANRNKGGMDV